MQEYSIRKQINERRALTAKGHREIFDDEMFYILIDVLFHDFICLSQLIYLNLVNFIMCYLLHKEAAKKESLIEAS